MGSLFEQIEKHAAENKRLQARVQELEDLLRECGEPLKAFTRKSWNWLGYRIELALQEGSDESDM